MPQSLGQKSDPQIPEFEEEDLILSLVKNTFNWKPIFLVC